MNRAHFTFTSGNWHRGRIDDSLNILSQQRIITTLSVDLAGH